MKSVLISIHPKWCELIASGKKTVEVRKTRPKIDTPFKCYIYCTSSNVHECLMQNEYGVRLIYCINHKTAIPVGGQIANGKVIGEFVCDRIRKYEAELWDDNTFERIQEVRKPEDFAEHGEYEYITIADNGDSFWKSNIIFKTSCLTVEDLRKYVGTGFSIFYEWHISDLVIYDKPKELREFWSSDKCSYASKDGCTYQYHCFRAGQTKRCGNTLSRPPQSWCYVDSIE